MHEPRRPRDDDDVAPRPRLRKKRAQARAKRSSAWLWAALGGGLLVVAGAVALIVGLSGNGGGEIAKDTNNKKKPPDVGPLSVAPAGEGLGGTSDELLASAVPPEGWTVTPDGVAPAPEGPRPLFAAPVSNRPLIFAGPGTSDAALVTDYYGGPRWFRYDLRKPPYPVEEVKLESSGSDDGKWAEAKIVGLSPGGRWLAGSFGSRSVNVWGTDGKLVGRFFPATANEIPEQVRRKRIRE